MSVFFTADTHFRHANILKYCNRPFKDRNEMDEAMLVRWNEVVCPTDSVYVVGDFALVNYAGKEWLTDNLNGNIYLIPGGHDKGRSSGLTILDPIFECHVSLKFPLILCHYPLVTWSGYHYGAIHLFGHCHGRLTPRPQCMDVGVDTHNFYPYAMEEIEKIFEKKT